MMRPTMHLRTRNAIKDGGVVYGIIEQLFVNDDQSKWRWVAVPLVKTDAATEGDGPPPISGDQQGIIMTNPIGYRELSAKELEAINEVKEMAQRVGVLVEAMALNGGYDTRWVAVARTQLQQGFMALTRSVAQPTTF